MKKKLASLGFLSLLATLPAFSAEPIDLSQQPVSALAVLFPQTAEANALQMKEVSRSTDFNQTVHIRIKETYHGYPVWGADGVVHIPQAGSGKLSSMNGKAYKQLDTDLANAPAYLSSEAQAQKALQAVVDDYQKKVGMTVAKTHEQKQLIVYVDKNQKAHYAFLIQFDVAPSKRGMMPARPVYIIDAQTLQIYKKWNDIKNLSTVTFGGGYGGNKKMGQMTYDGLSRNLPRLTMQRDDQAHTCYLQNNDVTVIHDEDQYVMHFDCPKTDATHNNVYWDGSFDAVHGGYSPANDALYDGAVIKNMYQDWYHVPVLVGRDGKPMMLNMIVHAAMDNAYWDGQAMTFGDGIVMFYPLTSIGVGAHEISHGFTEQHASLVYDGQSGGMNESFSDMAAQAGEFYAYGKNSWQIGPEIVWWGNALRYMDKPSKDCGWWPTKGSCSIDTVSDYTDDLDVHYSSGIYNRVFYLIGTAPGWNTRKAFDVMVQANMYYWTPDVTFNEGACGVLKATKDYRYDTAAVIKAFKTVGIDTGSCT